MSSDEGEPGPEQQQADAHEAPSGPTIATFASEWLGYAEVNIANDLHWYTNFPYLCLALLAATSLLVLWWKQVHTAWWGLPIWVLKAPLSALGAWCYLRWASPLQYESIAIKRSVGVEVCTRWKLFEESHIVPFTSLTAVVMNLVADEEFRLVVKARGDKAYTCFGNLRPDFLTLVHSYTDLASVLPRNVRKGQVAAIEPAPLAGYKLGRWWLRQVHFTSAGAACLGKTCRRWWRAGYYTCLRATNQLRHSERWQAASARLAPWMAQAATAWASTAWVRQAGWEAARAAGRGGLQVVQIAGRALKQQVGPLTGRVVAALRSAGITLQPVLQKVFAPQQQQQQQRGRPPRPGRPGSSQGRHSGGSGDGGTAPRAASSSGEEEGVRQQAHGQHTAAARAGHQGPAGQPAAAAAAAGSRPEAAAHKPSKGKGKGKGRKR